MKISEIADRCQYEFAGEDLDISSIRYAKYAKENSIAIVNKGDDLASIKAKCVLTSMNIINISKSIIYASDSIDVAAIKIAEILSNSDDRKLGQSYIKKDGYYVGLNVKIGKDTYIAPNVFIDSNVEIGEKCYIEPNTHIYDGTIIKNGVRIGSGSNIGVNGFYHYRKEGEIRDVDSFGIAIIYDDVCIGNNTSIQRGTFGNTIIGSGCKIGNLIDVGHDTVIGEETRIVSQSGIASNVYIGDKVLIYGQVAISNNVTINNNAIVYAKSLVTKNVNEGMQVSGIYAQQHIDELRMLAKIRKLQERKWD